MRIAVFGKDYQQSDRDIMQCVLDTLSEHSISIAMDTRLYSILRRDTHLQLPPIETITDNNFIADMALSIGGDGTFLHTATRIDDKAIPILGINTGRLGFLTDLSGCELKLGLTEILNGSYRIEERSLLQVQADGIDDTLWPFALNEVALLKQDSASMISIRTTINGEYLNTYQADGLVIATPTGSTAYALSVGGPVLVPQAANWVLAPVAPHSFTVRPLVVNDDVVISLRVSSRTDNFLLSRDGRSVLLNADTDVVLRKASFGIRVVKGLSHSFSETLRNKLMWGVDKRD